MEEKLFLTTVSSVIVYLTNYVLWNEMVFVQGFVLFMLVVVIALFITVNIANECYSHGKQVGPMTNIII